MTMRSFQDELTHFLVDTGPHLEDMTQSRNLIRYMYTHYQTVLAFFVIELILVHSIHCGKDSLIAEDNANLPLAIGVNAATLSDTVRIDLLSSTFH